MGEKQGDDGLEKNIPKPHAHDVLSGRGNFVNYHVGNENFRSLVKKHKRSYVACPKSQKANFSKLIFDEIRALNPPGRFLKQDPSTKLWQDIGEKKALDKTRQALREGAPELLKELESGESEDGDHDDVGPLRNSNVLYNAMNNSAGSFSVHSSDFQNITDSFTSSVGGHGNSFTTASTAAAVAAAQMKCSSEDIEQLLSSGNPNAALLVEAALLQAQQQHQQQRQMMGSKVQVSNNTGFNPTPGGSVQRAGGMQPERVLSQGGRNVGAPNDCHLGEGFNDINTFLASCRNSTGNIGLGQGDNNNAYAQLTQYLAANNSNNITGNNPSVGVNSFGLGQEQPRRGPCPDIFGQHLTAQSILPPQDSQNLSSAVTGTPLAYASPYQTDMHIITTSIPLKPEASVGVNYIQSTRGLCEPTPLNPSVNSTTGDAVTNEQPPQRRPPRSLRAGALNNSLNSSLKSVDELNNSLTRGSFTRRPNRHLQNDITSSLMSIESLTLEDIQSEVMISGIPLGLNAKHNADSLANMELSLAEFDEGDMSMIFEDESMGASVRASTRVEPAAVTSSLAALPHTVRSVTTSTEDAKPVKREVVPVKREK